MPISAVKAVINGQTVNLTLNSASGLYEGTFNAPGQTSRNQPGEYYNIAVTATSTAGNSTTVDGATLPALRLVVRETVPPTISFVQPAEGAYAMNGLQQIIFDCLDEAGGSGINIASLKCTLNGLAVADTALAKATVTNGYRVTFTPPANYQDGQQTFTAEVADIDGNSFSKTLKFTVDTVPPELNVTNPAEDFLTNLTEIMVEGTTNDTTSKPVTVTITRNGVSIGEVVVGEDGSFSQLHELQEGYNEFVITATDNAGQKSTVTRTIEVDWQIPEILSAVVEPNPIDTGKTVKITVEVDV